MLLTVDRPGPTDGRSISLEVLSAVAEREGVDVTDVAPPEYEPIYAVVDPEALDRVFAPRPDGSQRLSGRIEFEYCGYHVVVTDEAVDVTDP